MRETGIPHPWTVRQALALAALVLLAAAGIATPGSHAAEARSGATLEGIRFAPHRNHVSGMLITDEDVQNGVLKNKVVVFYTFNAHDEAAKQFCAEMRRYDGDDLVMIGSINTGAHMAEFWRFGAECGGGKDSNTAIYRRQQLPGGNGQSGQVYVFGKDGALVHEGAPDTVMPVLRNLLGAPKAPADDKKK